MPSHLGPSDGPESPATEEDSDASNQLPCGTQTARKRQCSESLECESSSKRARESCNINEQVELMLQTIKALAARVSILESSVQCTKAFPCPVEGCNCSFKRSDHLLRHMKHTTDPEHRKRQIVLERKYCFLCQKSFKRPGDLVRHESKSHTHTNRFEEVHEGRQLKVKDNKPSDEKSDLQSSHLIGPSVEFQSTVLALTSGHHTAGDVTTKWRDFFDPEDFQESSQILPSGSNYTKSTTANGFFDLEDLYRHSSTGGQAGDISIRESGFFDTEDYSSDILPSYTGEQVSNAPTGENGFDMQDSQLHRQSGHFQPHFSSNPQTLGTRDDICGGQADDACNKGNSFPGLLTLHGYPHQPFTA